MIRHGSASTSTRRTTLRATAPHALFPEIIVGKAHDGHGHLSENRMRDRHDIPSASSRARLIDGHHTLKADLKTKSP